MTDYSLFFGAFHPVVVHLPIGALLAAFALQLLSLRPRWRSLTVAVPYLYGGAVVGGLLAVTSGWALAGPVGDAAWDPHRWWGLGAWALCGACAMATSARSVVPWAAASLGAATVAATGWAGHLGGGLVHGARHFEQYAPESLTPFVGGGARVAALAEHAVAADPDSTLAYPTLIAPMLADHCVDCHGSGLRRGGLRLDSYAATLAGGREGGGLSLGGELWHRVTLPADDPRFMPSRGEPLSYDELAVLRAWLRSNPDSLTTVSDMAEALDDDAYAAIERAFAYNVRPLPYVERARPEALEVAADLRYWDVAPLSQRHTTLVARLVDLGAAPAAALGELAPYAANVTVLDISGLSDADRWAAGLPEMPHLTELDLSRSDAGNAAVAPLAKYPHLEVLKLTGTKVSDGSAERLLALPALRKLYLYDSAVDQAGLDNLAESAPDRLTVIGRVRLAPAGE